MFKDATIFNQAIGDWDVAAVRNNYMNYMFKDAKAFDQNLDGWCEDDSVVKKGMFTGSACADPSCGLDGNDEC